MFSVEAKQVHALEATANPFLKCVLTSFNKITSSKGLTFFFETGFDQGPLASLVSAHRKEPVQDLKLLLYGTGPGLENRKLLQ